MAVPIDYRSAGPGVLAANGDLIYPDLWQQTLTYNGDGTLAAVSVTDPESGGVYVQTLTYTTGNLTGISRWAVV